MLLSIWALFGDCSVKEGEGSEGIEADVGVAIVLPTVVRGFEKDWVGKAVPNLQINAHRGDCVCETLAVLGADGESRLLHGG